MANAFVAMVSHRAFRPAATFDEAVDRLFKQSEKIFDRGVVAVLVSYLDYRGGRLEWADFSKPPPQGGGNGPGGDGGASMTPPETEPPAVILAQRLHRGRRAAAPRSSQTEHPAAAIPGAANRSRKVSGPKL